MFSLKNVFHLELTVYIGKVLHQTKRFAMKCTNEYTPGVYTLVETSVKRFFLQQKNNVWSRLVAADYTPGGAMMMETLDCFTVSINDLPTPV